MIFIQEHKMKQDLCEKIGALGIRRGKAYWNGATPNPETNRHRGGTGIILSPNLAHSIINHGRKIKILEGMSTLSDHYPILMTIRKRNNNETLDISFKFNLSYLEDILIKQQI